jgi:APA family basic amino acid/polyamine antiporter
LAPLGLPPAQARLANQGLASAAIIAFALIHTSKASHATKAHSTVTLLKLGILGTFLITGLYAGWGRWENLADQPAIDLSTASAMLFSLVYISYAYTGWNAASYIAGEIAEPGRRLPQAILIGTMLVLALYLGLNLVYSLALPAAEIQRLASPNFDAVAPIAELAAKRLFGTTITTTLSIAFGLTLLASLSAYVLTGPRVAYAMARAGHFPAIAARLSSRTGAPVIATALQVTWALALLWLGTFEWIVVYASVGLALFSMLSVSTVIVLRHTRPDLHRPFRTPGYPLIPAVFLIGTACLTAAAFVERPLPSLYSLLTILAGVPVFYLLLRQGRKRLSSELLE